MLKLTLICMPKLRQFLSKPHPAAALSQANFNGDVMARGVGEQSSSSVYSIAHMLQPSILVATIVKLQPKPLKPTGYELTLFYPCHNDDDNNNNDPQIFPPSTS